MSAWGCLPRGCPGSSVPFPHSMSAKETRLEVTYLEIDHGVGAVPFHRAQCDVAVEVFGVKSGQW